MVVTDIKMENVSGIDLIFKVRMINNQTQFIILSGYADFNYAKSAIQNNVVSYLLKPVQKIELYENIKTSILNYKNINSKQVEKAKMLDLVFKDCAINYNPRNNYKDRLKEIGFVAKYNSFGCLYLFNALNITIESDLLDIVSRFSVNDYSQYQIINFNSEALPQIISNITELIKGEPASHIAISSISSIDNIPLLFQESRIASLNRFITPNKQVFLFDDTMTNLSNGVDLSLEYQDLKKAFLNKNTTEIISFFNRIFKKLRSQNNISVSFLLECFSNIYYSGINNFLISESEFKELYISSRELNEFIKKLLSQIDFDKSDEMFPIFQINNLAKNAKLKLALKHIEFNYISLQSIEELAIEMDISPNHLRKLFKVELDVSFSQYLLMYRMQKSKKISERPQIQNI